ncbi:MAG: DHH family phosphoesterase [Candidatus Omnitrophota bacterium]
MNNLKRAAKSIQEAKTIAISSHINPDGDSIGSLLSLGLGLESIGKHVCMLSQDGVPKKYRKLYGANRIKNTTDKKYDLAIAVDCGTKELLGKNFEKVFKQAKKTLEIDHHEFRIPFGDISLIDTKAAAVGELIFLLLGELKVNITKHVAESILTSLIVETDSFRLPKVRAFTFKVCEHLLDRGVDYYKLADMIFWSKNKKAAILSGICLSRCKFLSNGSLAWSIIRKNDFAKIKGEDEDVDTVADEIRSIQGVKIAVFFRENSHKTFRVSLRSKEKINIAKLAESYGGGGHFDVAGCKIPNNQKAVSELLSRAGALLS